MVSFGKHLGPLTTVFDRPCESACTPVRVRLSHCVAFGIIATALLAANAKAQDAEPRSYTNAPVGLNFLIAGYVYSEGKMAFDPSLPVTDAQFHTNTGPSPMRVRSMRGASPPSSTWCCPIRRFRGTGWWAANPESARCRDSAIRCFVSR